MGAGDIADDIVDGASAVLLIASGILQDRSG